MDPSNPRGEQYPAHATRAVAMGGYSCGDRPEDSSRPDGFHAAGTMTEIQPPPPSPTLQSTRTPRCLARPPHTSRPRRLIPLRETLNYTIASDMCICSQQASTVTAPAEYAAATNNRNGFLRRIVSTHSSLTTLAARDHRTHPPRVFSLSSLCSTAPILLRLIP